MTNIDYETQKIHLQQNQSKKNIDFAEGIKIKYLDEEIWAQKIIGFSAFTETTTKGTESKS